MTTNELEIKVPAEIVAFCEFEALNQIVSWFDERFSPEQIVREWVTLGSQVPVIDEWDNMFVVYTGLQGSTGYQLANQFDEYFEAFMNVARLAIVRTRVEVQK
jgi:hypothetical protein